MNTRQKLTLGIAAIFMVTLTVIGVTYAYFVTRINYTNGTATAVIETATIGSSYEDNNQVITLTDILPGQVVYKSFAVNNASDVPVSFAVTLASKLNSVGCSDSTYTTKQTCEAATKTWDETALQQFVHSTLGSTGSCSVEGYTTEAECEAEGVNGTWTNSITDECYVSGAYEDNDDTKPTACYNATTYDNILVELYRVEGYTAGKDDFITTLDINSGTCSDNTYTTQSACETAGKTWTFTVETWETCSYNADGTIDTASCDSTITKVPVTTNASYELEAREVAYCNSVSAVCNPINLNHANNTILEQVDKKPENGDETSNLYVLKLTYVNVNKNQNIENNASVSVKVDISATYADAITPNSALGA